MELRSYAIYLDDMRDPDFQRVLPKMRCEPTRAGKVCEFTKRQARKLAETYGEVYIFAQHVNARGAFQLKLEYICSPNACKRP